MEKIKITKEQAEELFRRDLNVKLEMFQLDSILGPIPFSPLVEDFLTNLRTSISHSSLRFYLLLGETETRRILQDLYEEMITYLDSIHLEEFEQSSCLPECLEDMKEYEGDVIDEIIDWYKSQEDRNIFQEANIFELIK